MNTRLLITSLFIVLTLVVAVWFLVFSDNTSNTNNGDVNTVFPVITATSENFPNDFRQLINENSSNEHKAVIENIHTSEYYVRNCSDEGVNKKVLILVAKYQEDANGINTFSPAQTAMANFESKIYQDWGKILFPTATSFEARKISQFETKEINNRNIAAESYRVGAVDGTKDKIYYGWLLNYIVIASSEACLLSAMEDLYHVH